LTKKFVKVLCTLVVLASLVLPTATAILPKKQIPVIKPLLVGDFDPLDDKIIVTVTIKEIRALKIIDLLSDPDFYVKLQINDKEFTSPVWENMKYVEQPTWAASAEVPKDVEFVNISIALWDKNTKTDLLCDISPDYDGNMAQTRTAEIVYSIAAGVWWGDDYLGDPSGLGRLSGIDDNSIYQQDRDCELWFDITQTDYDNDGLPYWLETNVYNTSPLVNNYGEDVDNDGIPIEWEHRFGLTYEEWGHDEGYYMVIDPLQWENHTAIDEDDDALNNIEEYKTWQWGSDPFRKDIFIEIDQMEKGPNGEGSTVPVGAYDFIRDSHARHNVVWHVDDGRLGGGEMIPFKNTVKDRDLSDWYWAYFMHFDKNNWRRGVFHWGIISYNWSWAQGFCFSSNIDDSFAVDCFFLSTRYHDSRVKNIPLIDSIIRKTFDSEKQREMIYAGAIMHEVGHSMDVYNPGVDNRNTYWPWQIGFWRFGPYKSVMNYRYIYTGLVDYSDGSRGKNDYDDWGTINFTNINPRPHW